MLNPTEIKCVLSNTINNSFESFTQNDSGFIEVILDSNEDKIILTVKDSGKGIPLHILSKLGTKGVTFGKEGTQSGNGLGVSHAKQRIEAMGGSYEIQSTEGLGTSVIMKLKKESPPDWFVNKIELKESQYVVAIDDDNSVLEIWKQRLSNYLHKNEIKLILFTCGIALKEWIENNKEASSTAIYLTDFELIGQKQTGLDLIENLDIGKQAILVSSRYEDIEVKKRCSHLGVKLIPKVLAALVPIEIKPDLAKIRAILIDDDVQFIHLMWQMVAVEKGISVLCFANESAFIDGIKNVAFDIPVYIDVNLGDGVKGQDVALRVHKLGLLNIYLSTGYPEYLVERPAFIRDIVNKNVPF